MGGGDRAGIRGVGTGQGVGIGGVVMVKSAAANLGRYFP